MSEIPRLDDVTSVIQTLAQQAGAPEKSEPGPGDVGPTTTEVRADVKAKGLVTLPMEPDEVQAWWKRVEGARQRIKAREDKWDLLLKEYLPTVEASGTAEAVKVKAHFRNVHSKIGEMFYRSPDLILTPDDPSPAQNQIPNPGQALLPLGGPQLPPLTAEDVISIKQAVLKKTLGRDGIKANRLMDELLFDVLAWAGIGCCKVGYRCVTKPVQEPVMQPDPTFQPAPSILGLSQPPPPMVPQMDPTGQPMMQTTDVPVYEEFFARRFSPKKLLMNADLRSTRFDEDATFMGMEFYMSARTAMRTLGLTEEEASKAAEDDRIHKHEEDKQGDTPSGLVHGVELCVKANFFTDEVHPQAFNQLILIEGITDRAIVWRPHPDQEFGPDGRLTPDSITTFPFRVLTIRDIADSAFPQSDSAFTNSEIKQLSTWRRQSIKLRDAAIGKTLVDESAFDAPNLELLKTGESGIHIPVEEGKLREGVDKIVALTPQPHQTNDDARNQEILKRDISDTLGISSVQSGNTESTVRSATEIADVQRASAGRNDKELSRVVDFYLDLARHVDQLLMRYVTEAQVVEIAGTAGAKVMQVWNGKLVSGRFLYDIAPDSQMRPDNARDFQLDLNFYNLAAQDPLFNRSYMLRRLARMRGMDPSKVVIQPPPMLSSGPPPPPGSGPAVPPAAPPPAAVQPPHGGQNTPGAVLSKHTASNSGARPNEPGQPNHRETQVQ